MLLFIASSVVLFPLAFLSHPAYGATVRHLLVPGIQGGVSSDAILLIIAIVGTTVAPWQLFFQQSNVVDKRITPRFIGYERADTFLGSIVVVVGAGALMIAGAYAVSGTALAGHFTSALGVAQALQAKDQVLGALFAIVLLDASIIGAAAVTLSTSYAFGDFFGLKHSLHRSFRDAKGFYGAFTALVIVAAGIVLIPGAPLGVVTEAVQALAGLLLPSASVFAAVQRPGSPRPLGQPRLAQRRRHHHHHRRPPHALRHPDGHHAVPAPQRRPHGDLAVRRPRRRPGRRRDRPALEPRPARCRPSRAAAADRASWRMPPLALLKPVTWSPAVKLSMLALRGYLVIAVLLLLIKAIQLGTG